MSLDLPLPAEHAEAMHLLSRLAVLLSGMTGRPFDCQPSVSLGDMFARQVETMKAAVDGHGRQELRRLMTESPRMVFEAQACGCIWHPDCRTCCQAH